VVTKGIIKVSQGQCVTMANKKRAVEIENNNQYKPLDFLCTSMSVILNAKIGGAFEIMSKKI